MAIGTPQFSVGSSPVQQAFALVQQSKSQRDPFGSMMQTFMRLGEAIPEPDEEEVSDLGPIEGALRTSDAPMLFGEQGFFEGPGALPGYNQNP